MEAEWVLRVLQGYKVKTHGQHECGTHASRRAAGWPCRSTSKVFQEQGWDNGMANCFKLSWEGEEPAPPRAAHAAVLLRDTFVGATVHSVSSGGCTCPSHSLFTDLLLLFPFPFSRWQQGLKQDVHEYPELMSSQGLIMFPDSTFRYNCSHLYRFFVFPITSSFCPGIHQHISNTRGLCLVQMSCACLLPVDDIGPAHNALEFKNTIF